MNYFFKTLSFSSTSIKYLLLVFCCLLALHVSAQNSQIGFINYQLIYSKLPDVTLAEQKLNSLSKQQEAQIQQKQKGLDQKYQAMYKGNTMASPKSESQVATERTALAQESKAFQDEIKKHQQEAHKARETLYIPIQEKIQKAMQEVCDEKGYRCIMDVSTVVYHVTADDITLLVLKKLNVNN